MKHANQSMKIEIRAAQPEDAASACDVLRRTISECCIEDHRNDSAVLTTWLGNKTPENVETWFRSAAHYPLVAVCDDRIEGVAMLTRTGKIVLFYVAPSARFHGVGTALLRAMETAAGSWGLRMLTVASTLTAQSFYSHHGFVSGEFKLSCFGTQAISFSKKIAATGSVPRVGPCRCGGTE